MTETSLPMTQAHSPKEPLPLRLLDRLAKVIDETDEKSAAARVARLKTVYPGATPEEMTERLIVRKCRDTAVVGATTSATSLIPGLGTLASLTVGIAADFGLTFKMQAELVLEIATVYGHAMTPEEKRRVVMMVTGLSAGTTAVAHRAGQNISKRVTARIASKYATKAVPFVGMAASAGTNAAMTYMIGKRAQAYFSLEPEEMADWRASATALTGINQKMLIEGAKGGGKAALSGIRKASSAISRRRQKQEPSPVDEMIPIFDNS